MITAEADKSGSSSGARKDDQLHADHGSSKVRRRNFGLIDIDDRKHDTRGDPGENTANEECRDVICAGLDDSSEKANRAAELNRTSTADEIREDVSKYHTDDDSSKISRSDCAEDGSTWIESRQEPRLRKAKVSYDLQGPYVVAMIAES